MMTAVIRWSEPGGLGGRHLPAMATLISLASILLLVLVASPGAAARQSDGPVTHDWLPQAEAYRGNLREGEGYVHEVNYDGPRVMIDGFTYGFAADAHVELGGNDYGAPTMLEPGMGVEFVYRELDDGRRQIVGLREMVGGRAPERH